MVGNLIWMNPRPCITAIRCSVSADLSTSKNQQTSSLECAMFLSSSSSDEAVLDRQPASIFSDEQPWFDSFHPRAHRQRIFSSIDALSNPESRCLLTVFAQIFLAAIQPRLANPSKHGLISIAATTVLIAVGKKNQI